jgi:hypothetical protein
VKRELLMLREGNRLIPANDLALEDLQLIRTSKPVLVTVHQARNPQHHDKLWVLATRVADFCAEYHDAQDAIDDAKANIPNMHTIKYRHLPDGTLERTKILKSICYASMDQLGFERFYDRAHYYWTCKIGTDPETLLDPERAVA